MIKNIIFDMGNVLIMFYPEKTFSKYLPDKKDVDLILDLFYKSGIFRECDRGTRTYAEVIDSIADKLPPHVLAVLKEIYLEKGYGLTEMPPFEEMYDLIQELKANGYKTYLLSNAGYDFYEYSPHKPAIALMDGKIISCEHKVLKPEKEIYEILFNTFSLDPSECIFIDDVEENIEGGKKCGMDGIVFSPSFEDVSVLREKLKNKGVKI